MKVAIVAGQRLLGLAVVGLAACSSSGSSNSGAAGASGANGGGFHLQVPLSSEGEAFIHSFGRAACDELAPCCMRYAPTFNVADCRASAESVLALRIETSAVSFGLDVIAPQFNAAYADGCLAAAKASALECGGANAESFPRACEQVFTPAAKPGEPCADNSDGPKCSPPPDGGGLGACGSTTCTWEFPAALGAPCEKRDDIMHVGRCASDPDAGVQCSQTTHVCVAPPPRPKLGESCPACHAEACSTCIDGLVCSPATGSCQPPATLGEACMFRGCIGGCTAPPCEEALSCNSQAGVCQARAKIGDSCHDLECEPDAYCGPSDQCVADGKTGDSCDSQHPCAPSTANCRQGVCDVWKQPGSVCGESAECPTGYICDSQSFTCTVIHARGQTCHATRECMPGDFCDCMGQSCMASGGGVCAARVALGQACPSVDSEQCSEGLCMPLDLQAAVAGKPVTRVCVPEHLPLYCFAKPATGAK